jgi:hypothetical protein
MVGTQVERSQVSCDSSVKDPCLLQHIPQVNVGIQKVWVEGHCLLKVVYGKPYFALRVEDAPEVGPGHREVRASFYSFQIASLIMDGMEGWGKEGKEKHN